MQTVIELVRYSREKRTIGVKQPLKSLVVIHRDQQYLDDVKSLESYISEELNIRDLVLTSDEEKHNVQYAVSRRTGRFSARSSRRILHGSRRRSRASQASRRRTMSSPRRSFWTESRWRKATLSSSVG